MSEATTVETLCDTRPCTMAAAYLKARGLADVQTFENDFGRVDFRMPVPTRLRHWREEFFQLSRFVYRKRENEELISDLTKFLNSHTVFGRDGQAVPVRVTNSVIFNVIGQLRAICQAPVETMPAWLDDGDRPNAQHVIAFTNGLLNVEEWLADEGAELIPPTEQWFSVTVLPRAYNPTAECPETLKFLREVLEEEDQILLFQEWCGLLLTRDTSFQKMLWLHGVGGGGKGTCSKLMIDLVGRDNAASFGLFDLTERFTLSSFMGKTLAVSHDAHIGNTTDSHKVVEHILAISGEDDRLIDRKNRELLQGVRLATRLVIATNGFPQLPDAGIALRRRSLILGFGKTFEATADQGLFPKLARELPGFTIWAMRGLRRLMQQRAFTQTKRGKELLDRLGRLSSPVRSFVEDYCEFPNHGETYRVLKRHLYAVWRWWQSQHGHRTMSLNTFSEKLYEAFPKVKGRRAGSDDRIHIYQGLRLSPDGTKRLDTTDAITSTAEDRAIAARDDDDVTSGSGV